MELFIEKRKSEKTNKEFVVLVADMGFVQQVLSYDTSIMILLSNVTPADFYAKTKNVGDKISLIKKETE